MCNLLTVPDCMANPTPGDTCTGWHCCKQNNQRLRCERPSEQTVEGDCIIERNQDCYTVLCFCEVNSMDRSTTTISSTQGVDSVDRSTTTNTTEIKEQNHPHKQR